MRARADDRRPRDPWPAALRLLTRRDHSTASLRRKLSERGYPDAAIEAVLERCRELGYVDDARFARGRARTLLAQGRAVGWRLLGDLRRQGISEETARQALDDALRELDEDQVLVELLARRYPNFDYSAATDSERRRVVHFLQRRGFPLDRIMATLTRKGL